MKHRSILTALALLLAACGGEDTTDDPAGGLVILESCEKYDLVFEEPQGEFCPTVQCDCTPEDSGLMPQDISYSVTQRGQCLTAMNCETACADALSIPDIFDCVE